MKIKNAYIIIALIILSSCIKEKIGEKQAESFIKYYGGGYANGGNDVKQLSDGSYVVIGYYTTKDSGTDMYLVKTNRYGNEIWHKFYGYKSVGYGIQVLKDGGFILVGYTTLKNKTANTNVFLVRTDANGVALWIDSIGGDSTATGYYVQVTSSGGFMIAGSIDVGAGITNALLVLTDSGGKLIKNGLQTYGYPSTGNTDAKSVIELSDEYLMVGSIQNDPNGGHGLSDICTITAYKKNLKIHLINCFGGLGNDYGEDLKQLSDGTFLCSGIWTRGGDTGTVTCLIKLKPDPDKGYISDTTIFYNNYNVPSSDFSNSITIVSDSIYALTGSRIRSDGKNQNILFLKTDNNGTQKTFITYGETGNQTGQKIISTMDGGFLIVGTNFYSNSSSLITLLKISGNGTLE